MKWIINKKDVCDSTTYEYYKGIWNYETDLCYRDDSIYLSDNVIFEHPVFQNILYTCLPDFTPFDDVIVYPEMWKRIEEMVQQTSDTVAKEIFSEMNPWVQDTFQTHGCFTIITI